MSNQEMSTFQSILSRMFLAFGSHTPTRFVTVKCKSFGHFVNSCVMLGRCIDDLNLDDRGHFHRILKDARFSHGSDGSFSAYWDEIEFVPPVPENDSAGKVG